jgi:ATP-dependent DNA ligase
MRARGGAAARPEWVAPQLTQLVDAAPGGDEWLHEIEYEGYRMHARLDRGAIKLLTRTGLDWTNRRPRKSWQAAFDVQHQAATISASIASAIEGDRLGHRGVVWGCRAL